MTVATKNWSLPGADGETILVSTESMAAPDEASLAVLVAHGFKGYKDYGFIPVLSHRLAEVAPVVVHRFNFSHSGMTNNVETFERPDLFERDTWNKQVADLDALINAITQGEAPLTRPNTPVALIGHSRGGTTCLLAAGRRFRDQVQPQPRAVITIAAPDQTMTLDAESVEQMRTQGSLLSPSARTGQELRQNRIWLDEQEVTEADHDVAALCQNIEIPVLIAHGSADPTVPPQCARRLAAACPHGELCLIDDADHVFNTPNPADIEAPMPPPLAMLCDRVRTFLSGAAVQSA